MVGNDQQPLLHRHRMHALLPERARALLLVAMFLVASLFCGWLSKGVYHEDDLTHYLFARWSQFDARYLLDCWGRPGFTLPYSWPASIGSSGEGLLACRAFSAVLSAATALLCYGIAHRLGIRHAWMVIPLLYCQPLFARLSLTTLTETPLAFYFALAAWLMVTGRVEWSAAVIALAPVTRDEAVIALPLWALAIWLRKGRWWAYPLLLWAIVVHNVGCAVWLGGWPALRWLQPRGADHYGQGTVLTFVPKLAYACGPVVVALAIMGTRRVLRRPHGWLIVLGSSAWFAAETFIYMRGAYSSGGYARFLVPICPWLALLGLEGLRPAFIPKLRARFVASLGIIFALIILASEIEWLWREPVTMVTWRNWAMAGRVGAGLLMLVLIVCAAGILIWRKDNRGLLAVRVAGTSMTLVFLAGLAGLLPLQLEPEQLQLREYSPRIAQMLEAERPVLTLNRWIYYWADSWVAWTASHDPRDLMNRARPGSIFLWDKRFCAEPVILLSYAEIRARQDWRLLWQSTPAMKEGQPYIACFERQGVMEAANQPARGPRD